MSNTNDKLTLDYSSGNKEEGSNSSNNNRENPLYQSKEELINNKNTPDNEGFSNDDDSELNKIVQVAASIKAFISKSKPKSNTLLVKEKRVNRIIIDTKKRELNYTIDMKSSLIEL